MANLKIKSSSYFFNNHLSRTLETFVTFTCELLENGGFTTFVAVNIFHLDKFSFSNRRSRRMDSKSKGIANWQGWRNCGRIRGKWSKNIRQKVARFYQVEPNNLK